MPAHLGWGMGREAIVELLTGLRVRTCLYADLLRPNGPGRQYHYSHDLPMINFDRYLFLFLTLSFSLLFLSFLPFFLNLPRAHRLREGQWEVRP